MSNQLNKNNHNSVKTQTDDINDDNKKKELGNKTTIIKMDSELIQKVIKIQAFIRGCLYRKNHLPNSILAIQRFLKNHPISISKELADGRTNSCADEHKIFEELNKSNEYANRIFVPPPRHWFDFAIDDFQYGWLPINIKSTTTVTPDNPGNLAMCVYALTNFDMNLKKSYQNGKMAKVLTKHLKESNYNTKLKRDYYFIVIDKKDSSSIIANSIKGLTKITPNINNLPFQIKWCKNQTFKYQKIIKIISIIMDVIKKPKPSWRETFLNEIRGIELTIT